MAQGWLPDVLGDGFEQLTLPLGEDREGPVVATLVRARPETPPMRAVLYIHGFVDYFFQVHMAAEYLRHGFAFYAIDLRKYGRSLLPHQTANDTRDIRDYFTDLDAALRVIRDEQMGRRVLLTGHSTGGLIAALYAHSRQRRGWIDGLFLNSPFFDFAGDWRNDLRIRFAAQTIGRFAPETVVREGFEGVYGQSISSSHRGEWDYDLDWKPVAGFPIRAGWLRAIHLAQRRLQRGLSIPCPVLVMHSTRSAFPRTWDDIVTRVDRVLDVNDMRRHAGSLGQHVTRIAIEDGMHDLTLSRLPVREHVFDELFRWIDAYVPVPIEN
jgi:alpha-beta hydrolase superfamily lysophospholipase